MRTVRCCLTGAAVMAAVLMTPTLDAQRRASDALRRGEWHDYAGDSLAAKYSPLDQINASNVKNLKVTWEWASADRAVQASDILLRASRYEDTPLMVKGTLYTVTPMGMVAALDPATGVARWVFDTESCKGGKPHSVGHTRDGLM